MALCFYARNFVTNASFQIRKINIYMADKGQFYLMQNYAFSPKECTLRNKHQLLPGDVRKQCCKTPLYCH